MKKIILILSFMLFLKNVDAETFYGDYYKVESLNNESKDEIKIDEYIVYNTYEIINKDLGYLEDNTEYIKDDNNFIENIIDSSKEDINSDEYITISTLSIERNTIFLGEISNNFKVNEIEVYYNNKKIDYEINNEHLYKNIENIKDNNQNTFFENTRLNNNLVLKLKEFYPSKDLKVIIYTEEKSLITFKMYVDNKIPIELGNNKKHIINFINDKSSMEAHYSYLKNKKLYKYYEEVKVPQNIYVKNGENLILDDYKVIKDFYKRDKLVLSDNLKITSKVQDINSFIEYSSNQVVINHNIDYTKNGIYKCEVILNDIKVTKNIVVDINENKIIGEINKTENIKQTNNNSNNSIKLNKVIQKEKTKQTTTQKTTNKKSTTKKSKNSNEINQTKTTEVNQTKITKVRNKNINISKTNINTKFVKTIIVIIFIILEIIIIYKKKKR